MSIALQLFQTRAGFFARVGTAKNRKAELLAALESLPAQARHREMYLLGVATLPEPERQSLRRYVQFPVSDGQAAEIRSVLCSLADGGYYERCLALAACCGSRDGAAVLARVTEKSRSIRAIALPLALQVCTDEQIHRILTNLPRRRLLPFVQGLRSRRRRNCIDRFLLELRASDRATYLELLPFATANQIEQDWGDVSSELSELHWERLARNHPGLALRKAEEWAGAAAPFDTQTRIAGNAVLRVVGKHFPLESLRLAKCLLRTVPLPELDLRGLITRKAAAVAGLVLEYGVPAKSGLERHLNQIPLSTIEELLDRRLMSLRGSERMLRRLPTGIRTRLLASHIEAWRLADGSLPVDAVSMLQRDQRMDVAREQFRSEQLRTRLDRRLPYASLLPWGECLAALDVYLKDPEGEIRSSALSALIHCVRYNPDATAALLELLRMRKHEQDPVRLAMLQALSLLPPSRWSDAHVESLGSLFRDALDAKDLSYGSICAMQRLVLRVLPHRFEWACRWFVTLLGERGLGALGSIDHYVSDSLAARLDNALCPVLQRWQRHEHEGQILAFAVVFGRRAAVLSSLLEILEALSRKASTPANSERALYILYRHARPRFHTLVPQLLKDDGSWATRPAIRDYLHRTRQDMLTPYLGQLAHAGRFATGKTRIIPPFSDGFHRWTPVQRVTYRNSQLGLLNNHTRPVSEQLYALSHLARLPEPPINELLALCRESAPERRALRDSAIQQLAMLDGGEGIEELLRCLDDDRARIAVYSLRDALQDLGMSSAFQILSHVGRASRTVFKEVVRLMGELRTQEAFEFLLALDRDVLHRDERIALLRALWNYLEREETWAVLHRAADGADAATTLHLARVPGTSLSKQSRSRLLELFRALLGHADPRARLAPLRRLTSSPVFDPERILEDVLLRTLCSDNVDESVASAQAIIATYDRVAPEVIGCAVLPITARRRNLSAYVHELLQALRRDRERYYPGASAALQILRSQPTVATLILRLTVAATSIVELGEALEEITVRPDFHAGLVAEGITAIEACASRSDCGALHDCERFLGAHPSDVLRRFGLAALAALATDSKGWNDERLAILHRYRTDSSALVAEAALGTFPANELG